MSFFEPPPRGPEPVELPQPEWIGPPDNVLGVGVPLRLVLGRSAVAAVAIIAATAYPTGLTFEVAVRVREQRRMLDPFHPQRYAETDDPMPPELVRLGVQFSDGRKATTLEGHPPIDDAQGSSGPVLMMRGGGGGQRSWDMRYWLWPLPPPGPLTFVVEWPLGEIPLSRVEVDAGEILAAAVGAEELWSDSGSGGSGGRVGYARQV